MGYILPITHHTYKNYQYRMADNKDSPHHIGATYKVVFHKINEEYDFNEKNAFDEKKLKKKKKEKREMLPAYQIDALQKAELTGKGGQFNEQV